MNMYIKAIAILIFISFISCNRSDNYIKIPVNQYQIQTDIIYSKLPLDLQIVMFRYEYRKAHGRRLYLMQPLPTYNEYVYKEIQCSEGTNNFLIYIRYSKDYQTKSCYLSWENESDPELPVDGQFYDISIGKFTKWIKTNLSEDVIRRMYPDAKCPIIHKVYSKIEIDFNKDMKSLDFFKSIKFVE